MSKLPGRMTRNQHWIPQFYLRSFADEFGMLHVFRKDNSAYFKTGTDNLCAKRDLYEIKHVDAVNDGDGKFYAQNFIENRLSEFEGRVGPLYRQFLSCCDCGELKGPHFLEGKLAVCALAANRRCAAGA